MVRLSNKPFPSRDTTFLLLTVGAHTSCGQRSHPQGGLELPPSLLLLIPMHNIHRSHPVKDRDSLLVPHTRTCRYSRIFSVLPTHLLLRILEYYYLHHFIKDYDTVNETELKWGTAGKFLIFNSSDWNGMMVWDSSEQRTHPKTMNYKEGFFTGFR